MNTSRSLRPTVLAISFLMVLALGTPAFADSIAVKQAEATRVQSQVAALNDKAEVASERYNAARVRYNKLTDKVHATQRQIAKLQKHTKLLQGHLNTRVNDLYRQGPLGFLTVLLSVRTFDDFDATMHIITSLNENDAATVAQLKAAKAAAQKAKRALVAEQTQAGRQR